MDVVSNRRRFPALERLVGFGQDVTAKAERRECTLHSSQITRRIGGLLIDALADGVYDLLEPVDSLSVAGKGCGIHVYVQFRNQVGAACHPTARAEAHGVRK